MDGSIKTERWIKEHKHEVVVQGNMYMWQVTVFLVTQHESFCFS